MKGKTILDAGVIYAPFIPLDVSAYLLQLPPSAVERLGALTDPALKKRIDEWDEKHDFRFEPFDMVTDPAVRGAVPSLVRDA